MLLTSVWLVLLRPNPLSSVAACTELACCIHLHRRHRVFSEHQHALVAAFTDDIAIYHSAPCLIRSVCPVSCYIDGLLSKI